jgi:hypothetical protein
MSDLNIFSKDSKIKFEDLYHHEGLVKLDEKFVQFFKVKDEELFKEYNNLKSGLEEFDDKDEANILINVSKILEGFLIEVFGISKQSDDLKKVHDDLSIIYKVKKDFIQRQVAKEFKSKDIVDRPVGLKFIDSQSDVEFELWFANKVGEASEDVLVELKEYAAWALFSEEGMRTHKNGTLFRLAKKIDYENLVDFKIRDEGGLKIKSSGSDVVERDGFKLTDHGFDLNQVLGEANYCIFCHNQGILR